MAVLSKQQHEFSFWIIQFNFQFFENQLTDSLKNLSLSLNQLCFPKPLMSLYSMFLYNFPWKMRPFLLFPPSKKVSCVRGKSIGSCLCAWCTSIKTSCFARTKLIYVPLCFLLPHAPSCFNWHNFYINLIISFVDMGIWCLGWESCNWILKFAIRGTKKKKSQKLRLFYWV